MVVALIMEDNLGERTLKVAMDSTGGKIHCDGCGKNHSSAHVHVRKLTGYKKNAARNTRTSKKTI